MKKFIALLMVVILGLSLCACGKPKTAKEMLTEQELALYNYVLNITSEEFFAPSAAKILAIGDYDDSGAKYETDPNYKSLWSSTTIVVKIQGENKVGGTINNCYLIALNEVHNKEWSVFDREHKVKYDCVPGDYAILYNSYEIEEPCSDYNIGNINRAFTEHWAELGF